MSIELVVGRSFFSRGEWLMINLLQHRVIWKLYVYTFMYIQALKISFRFTTEFRLMYHCESKRNKWLRACFR